MASAEAQKKWRDKNRFTKTQLNVMARRQVHDFLAEFAKEFELKGKGEAVTFASFATKALMQQADFNPEAARLLTLIKDAFHRDRDLFTP